MNPWNSGVPEDGHAFILHTNESTNEMVGHNMAIITNPMDVKIHTVVFEHCKTEQLVSSMIQVVNGRVVVLRC